MSNMRVRQIVVPDDGSDGVFWRAGERWLREHGREYRLLDLAPHLEAKSAMELLLASAEIAQNRTRLASLDVALSASSTPAEKQE